MVKNYGLIIYLAGLVLLILFVSAENLTEIEEITNETSNYSQSLIITEIMYNPLGSDSGREWVEIYNKGEEDVNLTEVKFYEAGVKHGLKLANGSYLLDVGGFAVIADKPEKFLEDYPDYEMDLFDSSFSLKNSGEFLALYNQNILLDEVNYSSEWGNKEGYSLELISLEENTNQSGNWRNSLVEGGTPGRANSQPCLEEWEIQFTNCSADNNSVNNTKIKYYLDQNDCGTATDLPEDNGTMLRCENCVPDFVNTS